LISDILGVSALNLADIWGVGTLILLQDAMGVLTSCFKSNSYEPITVSIGSLLHVDVEIISHYYPWSTCLIFVYTFFSINFFSINFFSDVGVKYLFLLGVLEIRIEFKSYYDSVLIFILF
jgi:hypothetical protein